MAWTEIPSSSPNTMGLQTMKQLSSGFNAISNNLALTFHGFEVLIMPLCKKDFCQSEWFNFYDRYRYRYPGLGSDNLYIPTSQKLTRKTKKAKIAYLLIPNSW